jgi:elongation factor P
MYSASDLRKGLKIQIDGQPWVITEFSFMKPGKGQSVYNCKMKNMITGSTMSKSYRSNDKMERCSLEEKPMAYSYADGDNFVFMDDDYEQITLGPDVLGDKKFYLKEDIKVDVLFHDGTPIDITFPNFIERKCIETEPGARGNTATNVLKPATVEGGFEVQVPIFVNEGDILRIDTRTGQYVDRAGKS